MHSDSSINPDDLALILARQALHRFGALTLLDPRAGAWEELVLLAHGELIDAAADVVRNEPRAKADPLAPGEFSLAQLDPRPVLDRLPRSPAAFNAAYERTFGLLSSCACPPCEAEYINGKFSFQRAQTLADVSGFYRAFGLRPSRRRAERHDHIVLELEFMAYLLDRERGALEAGGADGAERAALCRHAQQRFLREHLAWWAPALARLLGREDLGGFYDGAGQFLAALVAAERALLGVEPPQALAAPSSLERPEECDGCGLTA